MHRVLDHGYVRLVEAWGHGDAGHTHIDYDAGTIDYECGIIEAARQSTQASFRGWEDTTCRLCNGTGSVAGHVHVSEDCNTCNGKGRIPGDKKLLAFLYNNRHATSFEFAGMVIEVQAPIFVFREWHRHRTQSYNEMSARYAPLPDLNYVPTVERCLMVDGKNRQAGVIKGADVCGEEDSLEFIGELRDMYLRQEVFYQKWLKRGIPKELARIVLPVGRYSRMRASANLRNWLAFVTLRSDPAAQWEIRQYSDVVGQIIAKTFPRTWELFQAGRVK